MPPEPLIISTGCKGVSYEPLKYTEAEITPNQSVEQREGQPQFVDQHSHQ